MFRIEVVMFSLKTYFTKSPFQLLESKSIKPTIEKPRTSGITINTMMHTN